MLRGYTLHVIAPTQHVLSTDWNVSLASATISFDKNASNDDEEDESKGDGETDEDDKAYSEMMD